VTSAVQAIYTINNADKIVRFVAENPLSYKKQIQDGTGIPGSALGALLARLEATGVLCVDIPSRVGVTRKGYANRYSIDTDLVRGPIALLGESTS
jgi:hypothetical protein